MTVGVESLHFQKEIFEPHHQPKAFGEELVFLQWFCFEKGTNEVCVLANVRA